MPEELRVFIRAALYLAAVAAIYWFVSYESAGTLLLGAAAFACIVFVVLARGFGLKTEERSGGVMRQAVTLVALDDEGGDVPPPLEVEEEPVATASPWPLGAALALMLIGLGLLYGPWLWVPGAALAGAAGWGWLTQLDE